MNTDISYPQNNHLNQYSDYQLTSDDAFKRNDNCKINNFCTNGAYSYNMYPSDNIQSQHYQNDCSHSTPSHMLHYSNSDFIEDYSLSHQKSHYFPSLQRSLYNEQPFFQHTTTLQPLERSEQFKPIDLPTMHNFSTPKKLKPTLNTDQHSCHFDALFKNKTIPSPGIFDYCIT